ncbi:serpin family protein [Halobium palmae]|uniref:Serpin family protein n=1 Tax=Halobium palmae TaxID=1776492 RepID=A0ABD5RU70_9EURY
MNKTHLDRLVKGNTEFAFDVLSRLSDQKPESNLFVSPYSISVALAMTYAGSKRNTREQMADTLHFTLDQRTLHPTFKEIRQEMSRNPDPEISNEKNEKTPFQLTEANTLWGQDGYPWSQSFLQTLEANYGAGLQTLDFEQDASGARRRINQWVSEQTRDKIPELINSN